jgi:hypothetical protein
VDQQEYPEIPDTQELVDELGLVDAVDQLEFPEIRVIQESQDVVDEVVLVVLAESKAILETQDNPVSLEEQDLVEYEEILGRRELAE